MESVQEKLNKIVELVQAIKAELDVGNTKLSTEKRAAETLMGECTEMATTSGNTSKEGCASESQSPETKCNQKNTATRRRGNRLTSRETIDQFLASGKRDAGIVNPNKERRSPEKLYNALRKMVYRMGLSDKIAVHIEYDEVWLENLEVES